MEKREKQLLTYEPVLGARRHSFKLGPVVVTF